MSMKRILALLLTVTMLVSLGVPALAANEGAAPEKAEVVKGSISDKEFDPISLSGTKGDTKGADAITVKIYIYGYNGGANAYYYYHLASDNYDTLEEAILDVNTYMSSWAEQIAADYNDYYGDYGYTFYDDGFYCVYQLNEDISVDSINFPYGPGYGDEIDLNGHTLTINPGAKGTVTLYALYNGSIEILSDGDLAAAAAIAEQFSNIRNYGYERPTDIELTDDAAITGVVDLPDGTTLTVHDGETLDVSAEGAAINGSVLVEAGGKVIERMTWDNINDFYVAAKLGGTCFPATGYHIEGIQTLELKAGATEEIALTVTDMSTSTPVEGTAHFNLVSNGESLIVLNSGTLTKTLASGKTTIELEGDASVGSISKELVFAIPAVSSTQSLWLDGSNFFLPLCDLDLHVAAGTMDIAQDLAMVSGDVTVDAGTELTVSKLAVFQNTTLTVDGTLAVNGGLYNVGGVLTSATDGATISFASAIDYNTNDLESNTIAFYDPTADDHVTDVPVAVFPDFKEALVIPANYTATNAATDLVWKIDGVTPVDITDNKEVTIGGRTITVSAYLISGAYKVAVVDSDATTGEIDQLLGDGAIMIADTSVDESLAGTAFGELFTSNVASYYMNAVGTDDFNMDAVMAYLLDQGVFTATASSDVDYIVLVRLGAELKSFDGETMTLEIHPVATIYSGDSANVLEDAPVATVVIPNDYITTTSGITVKLPVPSNWKRVTVVHGDDTFTLVPVNSYVSFTVGSFSEFTLTGTVNNKDYEGGGKLGTDDDAFSAYGVTFKNHNARLELNYGGVDLSEVSGWYKGYNSNGAVTRQDSGSTSRLAEYSDSIPEEFKNDDGSVSVTLRKIAEAIGYDLPSNVDDDALDALDSPFQFESGAFKVTDANNNLTATYNVYFSTSKDQMVISAETLDEDIIDTMWEKLKAGGYAMQNDWLGGDDFVIIVNGSYIQIENQRSVVDGKDGVKNLVVDQVKDWSLDAIADYVYQRVTTQTFDDPADWKNELFIKAGSTVCYDKKVYTLTHDLTVTLTLPSEGGEQRRLSQDFMSTVDADKNSKTALATDAMNLIKAFVNAFLDDNDASDIMTLTYYFDPTSAVSRASGKNVVSMCTDKLGAAEDPARIEYLVFTPDKGAKRILINDFMDLSGVTPAVTLSDFDLPSVAAQAVAGVSGLTNTRHNLKLTMDYDVTATADQETVTFGANARIEGNDVDVSSAFLPGDTATYTVPLQVLPVFAGDGVEVYVNHGEDQFTKTVQDGEVTVENVTLSGEFVLTKVPVDNIIAIRSLSLEEEIAINLYFRGLVNDPSEYTVEFFTTINGADSETTIVPVNTLTTVTGSDSNDYYFVRLSAFPARQMTDTVTVSIKHGDVELFTHTYSVKEYCDDAINGAGSAQLATLCTAVRDYGSYAQVYFNYKTDTPANDFEYAISLDEIPVTYQGVNGNYSVESFIKALSLESKIQIDLYFKGDGLSESSFDVAAPAGCVVSEPVEVTGTDANHNQVTYWQISVSGFDARQLDGTVSVSVEGSDPWVYSPLSFCYDAQNHSNQKLADVSRAVYQYFLAAVDYFEFLNH